MVVAIFFSIIPTLSSSSAVWSLLLLGRVRRCDEDFLRAPKVLEAQENEVDVQRKHRPAGKGSEGVQGLGIRV